MTQMCNTWSLGSSSTSLDSSVLIAMVSAPASFGPWTGGCVLQHSTVADLLSAAVDDRIERFMTLPPSFDENDDDRKPSPSAQDSPPRKHNPRHSRAASLSVYIREDANEWLQAGLHLSSSEQEALIREQERMLSHWNASLHVQESSLPSDTDTIDGIPLTVLQSYIDCEALESGEIATGDIHPELLRQQAIMEQILLEHNRAQDESFRDAATPKQDYSNDKDMHAKYSTTKKGLRAPGRVEIYPGQRVTIHDKDRAYASLANGDAAIFRCAGCGKSLLAAKDTRILYCSECGTLTPTEIKGELKDSEYLDE